MALGASKRAGNLPEGLGSSLPGPRRVAFGLATLARHEMLAGGVGKLPRRYGPGEGTPQPLRERSPLDSSNSLRMRRFAVTPRLSMRRVECRGGRAPPPHPPRRLRL